jgi:hypothetical protein
MTDLTIFVSTFNRIDTLTNCLDALERQQRPKRIVIVDNGSWHPTAVRYLDQLARRYTVYRLPRIEDIPAESGDDDAHGGPAMQAVQRNVSEAFSREWASQCRPRWFGMTDADVHLDGPPDSLDVYIRLAEELDCAIGPHLRLNVHHNYPLRSAALIMNARTLFRERMLWMDDVPYSHDPIDTTFHLFPASEQFVRFSKEAVRVGPPWCATHSDWLIDVCSPTEENHAYILGCGEAASWGGRWIRDMFAAYLRSPEEAFALIEQSQKVHDDYFYPWFMLSWMYQYGHGCDQNFRRSKELLYDAVPRWSPCWSFEECWGPLVYSNDQRCLGW